MVMSVCGYFVILCPSNPMQQWKCVCLSSDYLICQGGQVYLSAWPSPTPRPGLVHCAAALHVRQPKIFSISDKIFLEHCHIYQQQQTGTHQWWVTEKFGKLAEDWWRREGLGWELRNGFDIRNPPSILLTQQKFKLDTKEGLLLNAKELNLFVMNRSHNFWSKLITF